MRLLWISLSACLVCLQTVNVLRAGVYNTAEPDEAPQGILVGPDGARALPYNRFRTDVLSDLIGIANPRPESPKRRHYLSRRDELETKARTGRLSVEEESNLGAYLIRLRQYEDAVRVLARAAEEDSANAMVLANLATAYQQSGQPERALYYLQRLKRHTTWPGLTPAQRAWYERAEEYQRKLVLLRSAEPPPAPGDRLRTPQSVDNLFGPAGNPVRFVGPSGKYEAGTIAAGERAKLPDDAVALVEQLLMWLPDDTRLYWLLGELLNAQGDVQDAAAVFEDCVWNRGWNVDTLKEHRRIARDAKPAAAEAPLADISVANTPPRPSPTPPSWLPGPRKLALVGGLGGLLVIALVILQVREMRRRRRV